MKKLTMYLFLALGATIFSQQYIDGVYTAQSLKPYHGWTSIVQLQVEKGEVTQIKIEDFDKNNEKRSTNTVENETLKKDIGVTYPEIVNNFVTQFNSKKNVSDIDEIAGATNLNKIFKNLTKAALENAEKGDTNRVIIKAK